jgi:hypothetical protein
MIVMSTFKISRKEYEQRVLHTLREQLTQRAAPLEHGENRVRIEEIEIDTSNPGNWIHILFTEESCPKCMFGYRAEAVEPNAQICGETVILNQNEGYFGPEQWAGLIIATNFEEQIEAVGLGLPPDCEPDRITWVNGYRSASPEELA